MSEPRREPAWYERILAVIPSGVDESLLDENLRLTPTERLERLQRFLDQLEAMRGAPR
ncbi:MAG TPA: hypothetical protein VM734_31765 [Kofleriaceae bacterium]|nr:hypothetical protein [Kofleriaceae bacterium]